MEAAVNARPRDIVVVCSGNLAHWMCRAVGHLCHDYDEEQYDWTEWQDEGGSG